MIATGDRLIINSVLDAWVKDNAVLTDEMISIQYYLRGALTRDDVWQLTPFERDRYRVFIEGRFKDAETYVRRGAPMPNL